MNKQTNNQNPQIYKDYSNSGFNITLRNLKTDVEQQNIINKQQLNKKFKIGDLVIGNDINTHKVYKGKIILITNKNVSIIEIKTHIIKKLDLSSIKKIKKYINKNNNSLFVIENEMISFENFLNLKNKKMI